MPLRARLCIFFLTIPLLFCGILDIDSWPCSNFPMYSAPLRLGVVTRYALFRVAAGARSQEVRSRELLWPLNLQRLQSRVRKLLKEPERLRATLIDYAGRWPLAAGEHLQLREQRVRLVREQEQLRGQVISSRLLLEVGP